MAKTTISAGIAGLMSGALQDVAQVDDAFAAFIEATGIKVVSNILYYHYGDHGRIRTIRTFWGKVTKTAAKTILENFNKHNRTRVDNKVVSYGVDMRLNRWEINGETIKFGLDASGDIIQLIDGSHRMEAVVSEGTGRPFLMVVGISPNAFKTIDQQNRRTVRDAFTTHGKNFASDRHGLVSLISRFEEDRLNEHRSNVPNISRAFNLDEKYELLVEEALNFAIVTHKNCSVNLSKATIAFLYMVLAQKSRFLAAKFLTALACGINLSATSPILKLRNNFIEEDTDKSNGNADLARYMNELRIAKIVPVWNAVCRNRQVGKYLRFDDKVSYAKSLMAAETPLKGVEAEAELWFNNEWPKIAEEANRLRDRDLSRREKRSTDPQHNHAERIAKKIEASCKGLADEPVFELDVPEPIPADVVDGSRSTAASVISDEPPSDPQTTNREVLRTRAAGTSV